MGAFLFSSASEEQEGDQPTIAQAKNATLCFELITPSSPQISRTDNDYPAAPVRLRGDIAR